MKKIFTVLTFITVCVMLFSGCVPGSISTSNKGETKKLSIVMFGDKPSDSDPVYVEINKVLLQKFNCTIEVRYTNADQYKLLLSSGEKLDIVGTANWLQYFENAAKGAFVELTDEMLEKYAPETTKNMDKQTLNASKVDGKRYAIPAPMKNIYKSVVIARGDLMEKYNIKDIVTLDDLGLFLDAVAKNEKDLIPFNLAGSEAWNLHAMYVANNEWMALGAPDATSPIFTTEKDNYKFFKAIDRPETREFSLKMKEWNAKGYWSKSALANKVTAYNSFLQGKSAIAHTNLNSANAAYLACSADERKSWNVRVFPVYNKAVYAVSAMDLAIAVSRTSKEPQLALQVIDALRFDETLNRLIMFGIKGKNYDELPSNKLKDINQKAYPGSIASFMQNDKHFLDTDSTMPDYDVVLGKLKSIYKDNPLINFRKETSNIQDTVAALSDVYQQYTAVRFLGFVNDVDEAIAKEKDKLSKAGLDKYLEELQKQVDKYLEENK